MTTETNPTHFYFGARERCIAELGGLTDIYEGKYLVCPIGENNFDCDGFANLKELRLQLDYLRTLFPDAVFINVGR